MARRDRYGEARKRKKRNAMFAPISFLLVCIAVVFGMGVFFRVQIIEVRGASAYTAEEVIEASGIDVGDNLFFINRSSASSRIFSRLSQVEEVASIERELPNKIIITIEESYALAYVNWEGQSWMLTGNCKLLGTGQDQELDGLIQVLAVTPESPESGEMMVVAEDDNLKLIYLKEILGAMADLDIVRNVSQLNMENPANPTFRYLDRFTVRMGPNNNSDYKLRMLLSAVMELDGDLTGTIDLSDSARVHFTPD